MSIEHAILATVEGDETADPDEYMFGLPTRRRPPKLFRDAVADPNGGVVTEVSTHLGTYGMGGPGFLGIQIEGGPAPGRRWLVVTLWAAAGWATIDGDLVAEEFAAAKQAELSNAGRGFRSITQCLVGARLVRADCSDDLLLLDFEREGARHRLEIRRDGRDVPPWSGTGQPRSLAPEESMRDAVVVSESGYLWLEDEEDEAGDAD